MANQLFLELISQFKSECFLVSLLLYNSNLNISDKTFKDIL